MKKRAHLIAFIGLDGAGKTTQALRLSEWLQKQGHTSVLHPNESLQPMKTALIKIASEAGFEDPIELLGPATTQLMIAMLKWNTMIKAQEALCKEGQFVLMDRYTYCQIAAARHLEVENAWLIEKLFEGFPRPDLTLFIDVSPDEADRRQHQRNSDASMLPLSFLQGHLHAYRQLPDAGTFVSINGEQSINSVSEEIRNHVLRKFPFIA